MDGEYVALAAGRLALHAVERYPDLEDQVGTRMLRQWLEHCHTQASSLVGDGRFGNCSFVVRRLDHLILSNIE